MAPGSTKFLKCLPHGRTRKRAVTCFQPAGKQCVDEHITQRGAQTGCLGGRREQYVTHMEKKAQKRGPRFSRHFQLFHGYQLIDCVDDMFAGKGVVFQETYLWFPWYKQSAQLVKHNLSVMVRLLGDRQRNSSLVSSIQHQQPVPVHVTTCCQQIKVRQWKCETISYHLHGPVHLL